MDFVLANLPLQMGRIDVERGLQPERSVAGEDADDSAPQHRREKIDRTGLESDLAEIPLERQVLDAKRSVQTCRSQLDVVGIRILGGEGNRPGK